VISPSANRPVPDLPTHIVQERLGNVAGWPSTTMSDRSGIVAMALPASADLVRSSLSGGCPARLGRSERTFLAMLLPRHLVGLNGKAACLSTEQLQG
jgi:hypothetical protein